MSIDFKIKTGDLEPSIQQTLTDQNGAVRDLTGRTITLSWKREGDTVTETRSATIVGDATLGVVKYDWVTGDTDVAGIYNAEWVTTAGGSPDTFPTVEHFQFQFYSSLPAIGQHDILWTEVANFDPKLANLDTGAQTHILAHVNTVLSTNEWGGEASPELRLARIYLAAHHGTMALRGDNATGPAVAKSAGPISIQYAAASPGGTDTLFSKTNAGLMYLAMTRALPARAPMVI